MSRWRYPSLSLHGIHGAFSEPGCKTVIPRKVSGKFSIRIVPNQTPDKINELVKNHLGNMWKLITDLIIVDEPEKSIEAIEVNELTGSI